MYESLIKTEAEKLHKLHQNMLETCRSRKKEPNKWENACQEFHAYTSPLDPHIDRLYQSGGLESESIEFAIQFLEINPFFVRSGYIKEQILTKLKRAALSKKQTFHLRAILRNAVLCCPYREYKRYCRLAVFIANQELDLTLAHLIEDKRRAVRSRARLMLQYMTKHRST